MSERDLAPALPPVRFPLTVPRQPVGEPLPPASEATAFQVRGCLNTPGTSPDGLYQCLPSGGGWAWFYIGSLTQAQIQSMINVSIAAIPPPVIPNPATFTQITSGDGQVSVPSGGTATPIVTITHPGGGGNWEIQVIAVVNMNAGPGGGPLQAVIFRDGVLADDMLSNSDNVCFMHYIASASNAIAFGLRAFQSTGSSRNVRGQITAIARRIN